ncbi:MAG: DNA (cytosine-5-)-methyltransferase [Spirulina sp. SIO3F2]|nr:DNA (cytosine-5-)-methyltransferase [Spirulina sp. SIO3F2]
MTLRHLDLFSGIGGFTLAAQMVGGIETLQFVENDPRRHADLKANFPGIPVHDDIRTFNIQPGQYDLVTAGFPCQGISNANPKARGLKDKRSGLFYQIIRLVRQGRPRYLILENSPNLLAINNGRDMGTVLWELAALGFDAEWSIVSACSVGAPHTRERLFVVAYAHGIYESSGLAVSRNNDQHLQPRDQAQGGEF